MKAKVIKRFKDKQNKKVYGVGTVFEGTKNRVEELQKKSFLGEVVEEKKKKTSEEGE